MMFDMISANVEGSIRRSKIPGVWLVHFERQIMEGGRAVPGGGGGGPRAVVSVTGNLAFVPNPEHLWDGGSLP